MRRLIAYNMILLLAVLLMASCGKNNDSDKGTPLPVIPVKTMTVTPGPIEVIREFSGGLEGIKQADVTIRLSEAVTALSYRIGDQVKDGQVIISLDKGGASSQYLQAKAGFENAEKNYNKMKSLFEQKAISEMSYDQADAAFQVAKANYQAAKELVDITSPIDGVIVEQNVKVGDVPHLGTVAARIARIDSLRMTFGVPTEIVSNFHRGMTGTITIESIDTSFECSVNKVSDAADPATRAFSVEIVIPNSEHKLQAGTFAKAKFVIARKDDALSVPQSALISDEGIISLFVVKNDSAYARTVQTGIINGVKAEIVSGVNSGDEVVVLGQTFLSNGYPITRSQK